MHTLSVSALNEQIKHLLEESFSRVFVEGELSRITFHNSGHIYFTLKDKDSAISAVMFRGNASKLKFRLEEGMRVVIDGAITLYKPRGSYQINCFSIEPSGQGALALAYEQLKQKLSAQGYFNPETKKQLPKFPSRIALVTSATGAALQDMLRVANARYRLVEIDVHDVLVQGESAAASIAHAINMADTKGYDIIVIGRGGGSLEDLGAFNEEIVADAVFHAKTPIVSAVGHEIDWLISDFTADLRAPTPSAAMEMILPDTNELYMTIDSFSQQLTQLLRQKIQTKQQALQHLKLSYEQHSVERKLQQKSDEIKQLREAFTQSIDFKLTSLQKELQNTKDRFPHAVDSVVNLAQNQLLHLRKMLESNHPKLKTKKGFAQIAKEGVVVDIADLKKDDIFEAQSEHVVIEAKVLQTRKI
ncbi:exodeoxyribonuclease VII large subunit [Sulfurimonas paralvinellae]|uniref:Exodeoxyribonuclease 7 large subunit n=1 Tax=Sulfurimonas paralvinellae TaxID=317658 RepID=A0A7M1B6H7_9BACT|nr:exodeoxyribonuclease VII large subunit [Sulfurimonas paralvinellae]QOP45280.1 exodeoxyribonuclease VII large subunit [Sulfurimonas paralvinellae]